LEWMAVFVSLVTIAQFWGHALFPEPWLKWRFFREITWTKHFHGQGLMMFHLSFASIMSFSVAYFTARLFWDGKVPGRFGKVLLWLTPILTTIATFYSYSRTAWVALAAIFITLAFLRKRLWGFCMVAAILLSVLSLWRFDPSFHARIEDSIFSTRPRLIVWHASWDMVKERPFTGVGHAKTGFYSEYFGKNPWGGELSFASHAHNNFLEMFSSTGVIGLLIFLAWWGVLLAYAIRSFRCAEGDEKWLSAGVLAAAVAFHVNGMTQVNFYDGKTDHTLVLWAGILLAQYLNFGRKRA
jgi:O-antigen ligase